MDQFIEFDQLIDRKNSPIHSWSQPEVQRLFRGHADPIGELRRVNLTNDVCELSPRRKTLRVATVAMPPFDWNLLACVKKR